MLNFPIRSHKPEILDDFELEGNDLTENLKELEKVSVLLGGNAVVKEGVEKIIQTNNLKEKAIRIADVGCGGGDALRMLSGWAKRNKYSVDLIGVDANTSAVKYASERTAGFPDIRIEQLNILSPEFKNLKADIVMFNLFLHHFEEAQIIGFLKICKSNGSSILINDLQRSRFAYHGFRLASRILGFSYIGRHDGKLSVKKSFIRDDWDRMMKKAGITNYSIKWRWAFRYSVLIYC